MTRKFDPIQIRGMYSEDWSRVRVIYQEGIETRNATFETSVPDWIEWDKGHLSQCRLVAVNKSEEIVGWAALSPVSGRCVYSGIAEVSVYVAETSRGLGVGSKLLAKLVECSEEHNIWMLQAGIFPENSASIALHKNCGFRQVGIREKLGQMNDGRWRDVVLMELRSKITGV